MFHRRREKRFRLKWGERIPCQLRRDDDEAWIAGMLFDVSEHGAGVTITEKLELPWNVEDSIHIRAQLPDANTPLRFHASLRHTSHFDDAIVLGFALEGSSTPSYFLLQMARLKRFISKLLRREAIEA